MCLLACLQSFPLARRSVLAALAAAALLLDALPAQQQAALERDTRATADASNSSSGSGSWQPGAWSAEVDAKVLLLLGQVGVLRGRPCCNTVPIAMQLSAAL